MWFATDDILAELSLGRSCDSPLKGGAEEMELPSCPRPRRRPRCPRGSARALLAGSRVGTKTRIVPEPLNCISARLEGGVLLEGVGQRRAGVVPDLRYGTKEATESLRSANVLLFEQGRV